MPTKVFSYGAKPPRKGMDLIENQIRLGHRYYNRLIELRRKQMEDTTRVRCEMFPDFDAIEQRVIAAEQLVKTIVEEIKAANARAKRRRATAEESARLKAATADLKDAREKRKEIRKDIAKDVVLQERLAAIYAECADASKAARATCGVYWGSYLKVEAAVESAVERTIGLPGFKRWSGGSGQVAVQIQLGCTWQEMLSGSGRVGGLLKAEPLPCNRTSEKSARPWLFSIRVGSDEQRKPVWAKVMVYLHPTFKIPYDGRIMGVSLVRRALPHHRMSNGRYEPRFDWSMQFTVRVSEEKPRATSGACGIDLGWRLVDGGLRVAYLVGSDGHPRMENEELILPTSLVDRWEKSESIQSIRDRSFNEIRAKLLAWMAETPQPEWFVEQTEHLAQWKSLGRLSRLVASWEERRIDGDDEIFVEMTKWRDQDFHLWQYGAENLLKAQRIRLHIYRNFARRVAMRYGKIFVEDCDWRQIAKKVRVDKNKSDAGAKTYMRIASVGKLRDLLKQDGATMVDSTDTTKKCHACGSIEEFDHAKELVHTCGQCALVWDQDYNAAVNLLTGGVESGEPEVPAVEKKKYVGRFQKRKDKKQQKDQRADDAA